MESKKEKQKEKVDNYKKRLRAAWEQWLNETHSKKQK